jgi:hypothetical protein
LEQERGPMCKQRVSLHLPKSDSSSPFTSLHNTNNNTEEGGLLKVK